MKNKNVGTIYFPILVIAIIVVTRQLILIKIVDVVVAAIIIVINSSSSSSSSSSSKSSLSLPPSLFKQLVSRHNVNRTNKNLYRRIAGADKPRDQQAKCLWNKNVFKLRLNEARVNWLSIKSWGRLFQTFGAEKQNARLPKTVLGVGQWRSLCDAECNCLWGW